MEIVRGAPPDTHISPSWEGAPGGVEQTAARLSWMPGSSPGH